ncbi:YsnF/AvaK domain-containing protein [Candidatus Cyanaurora vandensis]|uniref:YsnF/AvaK domain-containing protein n=1 Tax=Candidatus Cyanaurora vandensis TaxID=2714958 RepID=UPI00257E52DB|nr:YsnF/AvaK domain-containing protein [Candidatus Cyanaurora vandensis]
MNSNPNPIRTERSTVAGLFSDSMQAESAIHDLQAAGFSLSQIQVAMRDRSEQQRLIDNTGTKATATMGSSTSGGILGSIVNFFTHDSDTGNRFYDSLVSSGLNEDEARYFEGRLHGNNVLVVVNGVTQGMQVLGILEKHGADLGTVTIDTPSAPMAAPKPTTTTTDDRERIQLRQEELNVRLERVESGEVRIRKEVITENKTIEVPVTHEELVIERHPVNRVESTTADFNNAEEIRIPLSEDQIRVEKRAVVTEEVMVGKREVQEQETVQDTVRREEIRIETEGEVDMRDRRSTDPTVRP